MSLHKSLKVKNRHVRRRNVLSREERVARLENEERWTQGQDSVFGLPKVRVMLPRRAGKEKKKEAEALGEAGAEGATGAPAAGAAKGAAK